MSTETYSTAGERLGTPDRSTDSGRGYGTESGRGYEGQDSAVQQVKARAGQLLDDAKDSAQSHLNEKKDVAAEGLHNVAGALRDAADRGGGNDPLLGLTASAADGLDRLSSALRNKDVGMMMRDVETFARNQPVAFFGLALATGFLAVRFMKASHSS